MLRMTSEGSRNDDPRKLREMLVRAQSLASEHDLPSVVVGLAGEEGDLIVSEVMDFIESQLRVDDAIFRMTRERAVLLLADVDVARARDIVERLVRNFCSEFTPARQPEIQLGYFEIPPGNHEVSVKRVLPSVFSTTQH